MLEDLFYCLLVYLLYRFVFELVIPISRTVSKMKKTAVKMQGQNGQFNQTKGPENQPKEPKQTTKTSQTSKSSTTNINEEYIDFEEIK